MNHTTQPTRPRWWTRNHLALAPIIIAAVGVALSVTVFSFMTHWETRAARAEFERDCHDMTRAIERSLEAQELVLEAMRSYIDTANTIDRRGFGQFVAPFLQSVPGIQALEWIPRVPHARRVEYERKARNDGLAGFRITERKGPGIMVPAGAREIRQVRGRLPVDLTATRVLIVDDNPDNQAIIAFLLQEEGADVGHAYDGAAGVKAVIEAEVANTPYDLILMDMRMPVMDGYTAVAALRGRGVATPIIALTAHAMAGDEGKCLSAGCNAYVTKPVVAEVLVGEIMRQLQGDDNVRLPQPSAEPTRLVSSMADNPRFAPRLNKYLARIPKVIDELEAAYRASDTEALCSLVHRLHGTAASFGFPDITEVAGPCEEVLRRDGDISQIRAQIEKLIELLNAAKAGSTTEPVGTNTKPRGT